MPGFNQTIAATGEAFTDVLHENRVALKDVMRAAAQALAAEHGLSFKLEKGSFNRGQFRMVLKFGVPAIEEEMRLEFCARIAPALGLPETIVGTDYTADGQTYTVVGISPKLQHKCIQVVRQGTTEPRLVTTPNRVRIALGLPDPDAEIEYNGAGGDAEDE